MNELLITVALLLGNGFFVAERVRADRVPAHRDRADGRHVRAAPAPRCGP